MNGAETEELEYCKRDARTCLGIIVSRNKLINELIEELPHNDKEFKKALGMRTNNWAGDKDIIIKNFKLDKPT